MPILLYKTVRLLIRSRLITVDERVLIDVGWLRVIELSEVREGHGGFFAGLDGEDVPVYGAAVYAGWCAGFEASEGKVEACEGLGESYAWGFYLFGVS